MMTFGLEGMDVADRSILARAIAFRRQAAVMRYAVAACQGVSLPDQVVLSPVVPRAHETECGLEHSAIAPSAFVIHIAAPYLVPAGLCLEAVGDFYELRPSPHFLPTRLMIG